MKTHPFHILLADDDPSIRLAVESILKHLGHTVEVATDGREAIEAFTRGPETFELIITDHSMPNVTGLQLVQYVRANGYEGKIIVISGSLTPDMVKMFQVRRVDTILQKPFTMERLKETLEGIFSRLKKE